MGDFLTGGSGASQKTIIYSGLQVGSSQLDIAIPWMRGQCRMSTNVIDYVNFQRHKHSAKGKGGGKGSGQYTYSAAVLLSLSYGIVTDIFNVWSQGSTTTTTTLGALGFNLVTGTNTQLPWSYLSTAYPSHALAYRNIAYIDNQDLDLGSSASVPDIGLEAKCCPYSDVFVSNGYKNPDNGAITPGADVNMADFLPDFLTSTLGGMAMPLSYIPDVTEFREYQAAQGLFFSPYLKNQEKALSIIDRWAQLSNCWIYDSGTSMQIVTLGDTALTANGYTYTPDLTPIWDFGPEDFVTGSPGDPPVQVDIKDESDVKNRTIVSITDRTMGYVTNPKEYKAESLIRRYGRNDSNNIQADEVKCPAVGQTIAQLVGRREANILKTYSWHTSWRFERALPGVIVTLTDPSQNLSLERVRVTDIDEEEDGSLSWKAEQLPSNVGSYYPRVSQPGPEPATPNLLIDPGNVNTPAVCEPAARNPGDSTKLIVAASGGVNWGGCDVWISFNGTDYSNMVGQINAPAIQGVLTASLASYGGVNPDVGHTLAVDCTASGGEPEPVTNADAAALRTLSLVNAPPTVSGSDLVLDNTGELLAFGNTAATGTNTANLTYLYRGTYGTSAVAHSSGALFTLFDLTGHGSTIEYTLPVQYVGQTLWLKFASFNVFGKSTQDLSVCQSYKFTPSGAGFGGGTGGVPTTPTGLAAASGIQQVNLSWSANPSTDNVFAYKVYRAAGTGAAFGSATLIATVGGQAYTDTGLTAATGYTYFLKAQNIVGLSAATSGVNATTSATPFGDVVGPAGATDGDFALFNGATGKVIKDSGLALDIDGTLTANSDSKIPSQKAVKTYTDAKLAGLSWKQAVRASTIANGTLATAFANGQVIDGVTLVTGDRILVKNQSAPAENGIYVVAASGAPARSTDADSGAELVNASVYISEGSTLADTQWTCTTNAPIALGSTSLAFAQLGTGSPPGGANGQVQYNNAGAFGGFTVGGDATLNTATGALTLAADSVTYAKMQNVSATSRVLGRKTAGAGDTEELTLSELLDFVGPASRGDILYRGASSWARLAAGTSGYVLQTGGAGADPAWVAAATGVVSWIPTVSGAEPPVFITDGAGNLIFTSYSP